MATRAYHIYSHYEPPQEETSGEELEAAEEKTWNHGHAFGLSKRATQPPKFVKSSGLYDEPHKSKKQQAEDSDDDEIQIIGERKTLGSWYRNLPRAQNLNPEVRSGGRTLPTLTQNSDGLNSDNNLVPSESRTSHNATNPRRQWFLSNLAVSAAGDSNASVNPAPTLSDMIHRDPPPHNSDPSFVPPTWIALGPSNVGYAMLSRNGWKEGQGLGQRRFNGGIGKAIKTEPSEFFLDSYPLPKRPTNDLHPPETEPELIDLTLSDEDDVVESERGEDKKVWSEVQTYESLEPEIETIHDVSGEHGSRPLLVPLPTLMKTDLLGIGLRSKQSQRQINDSSDALSIVDYRHGARPRGVLPSGHSSQATAEDAKPLGSRGLARKRKREEKERVEMLAYMKSN